MRRSGQGQSVGNRARWWDTEPRPELALADVDLRAGWEVAAEWAKRAERKSSLLVKEVQVRGRRLTTGLSEDSHIVDAKRTAVAKLVIERQFIPASEPPLQAQVRDRHFVPRYTRSRRPNGRARRHCRCANSRRRTESRAAH